MSLARALDSVRTLRRRTPPGSNQLDPVRLTLLGAALGLSMGCTLELPETVRGSGVPATEFREVDVFYAVDVYGGLDVEVVVGEPAHVTLNADDNLIPYVEAEVQDGRLQLRVRGGFRLDPSPRIEVGARELAAISLLGSGNVEVRGVEGAVLALELTGSGDMSCAGAVERLDLAVTGSGNMHLRQLVAAEVAAGITGSGDIETHVTRELSASITGSGDLIYRGEPQVVSSITGSGEVRSERD